MFEKQGKYYADWYDNGQRKRKAFTTKKAAIGYEDAMREAANPQRPRRRLATSARRSGQQQKAAAASTRRQRKS